MNPVAQQLASQNPVNALIDKINRKEIDPKAEVLRAIAGFSPAQKTQLQNTLPMLQNVAKRMGVPLADIASFSQEVTASLA